MLLLGTISLHVLLKENAAESDVHLSRTEEQLFPTFFLNLENASIEHCVQNLERKDLHKYLEYQGRINSKTKSGKTHRQMWTWVGWKQSSLNEAYCSFVAFCFKLI